MRVHQWRLGPMRNFAYLFADDAGDALLVDPAFEVPRLLDLARGTGARVRWILATHGHHDHVQGIPDAKRATGAQVLAHVDADHPHDRGLADAERLRLGGLDLEVLHTPGHRFDSVCVTVGGTHLVTGDTLFVGDCGRVDLPGSDPAAMHRSLLTTLARLPEDLVVCPGHDYGPRPLSTLAQERRTNPALRPRGLDEFLRFMAEP
ncbi:MAG TPA: MBL fold metallo-hydrolase [Candidatus Thermoplasmatota archaeon]|nr:MBL fold metallo-hydrolase [Candidatus Thermoplasmatota archaeon]